MSKTAWISIAFWWTMFAMINTWVGDVDAGDIAIGFGYYVAVMLIIIHITKKNNKEISNVSNG